MILPGATLGVVGGGQLGRMFTCAARIMGYRVVVLDPDPHSPAGALADQHLQADYTDRGALEALGRTCAAITTEFENVPAQTLERLAAHCPVRPAAAAVAIVQDRIREKTFLRDQGLPTAPFEPVFLPDGIEHALRDVGTPALLKRAALGYDGKGQATVEDLPGAIAAFDALGGVPCVLERRVELQTELSVVLARDAAGSVTCYPVAENTHRAGILDTSVVPARVPPELAARTEAMACAVATALDYCGVMAVEFFVTTDGELLINEIAPRPHNSGHYTLDACVTSQFEQQVRMLCGLPAGDTRLLSPVVMVNLLGDVWGDSAPAWETLLADPRVKLHLYGKAEARPGRKMGHFNLLDPDLETALADARALHDRLGAPQRKR
jgi:5-(carboxyamino)imidazole ribonucleotide synthase